MIRNALFAVAVFAATAAHSQSEMLVFNRVDGVVIEPATGARFPVIASEGGDRPTDCPPGSFWTKEVEVGAVLEECDGDSRYQIMGSEVPAAWGLLPWPRPIGDDDPGPRIEE